MDKTKTMSTETTLKPCPFCGSDSIEPMKAYRDSEVRHFPMVRCMGCYAEVSGQNCDWSSDAKTARQAWNRRSA